MVSLKVKVRSIDYIIMTILVFLLIFNPPIKKGISFTLVFVMLAILEFMFYFNYMVNKVLRTEIKTVFTHIIIFLLYTLFTGTILGIIAGNFPVILGNIIESIGQNAAIFLVSLYVLHQAYKRKITFRELVKIYVFAGVIQSVFSIISFFIAPVRDVLNAWMVANVNHENIATLTYWSNGTRCFGFASNLFDVFGCAMSMLAVLAFSIAITERKLYFVHFIMIAFSAIINSRTSIILIGLGVFLLVFLKLKQNLTVKRLSVLMMVIVVGVVGVLCLYAFLTNSHMLASASWLQTGIDSIIALVFKGEKIGYFETLFNKFLFFPENIIGCVFGTGMTSEQAIQKGSDVGYIQDIWKFGLIGSLVQYKIYANMIKRANRKAKNIFFGLFICLGIMLFVYLIKLSCLGYGMPTLIIMPLVFSSLALELKATERKAEI